MRNSNQASSGFVGADAQRIHASALVIDGLQAAPMTPTHFERLRVAGIDAVNYTCANINYEFAEAVKDFIRLHRVIADNPNRVLLVEGIDDITRAKREGKTGIIMGLQNGRPIMNDLAYLEAMYRLGVRIIQLTYNERNLIGDGCVERANGGLSRFGRKVVQEMNRLGILVDLSHCGERTTLDAIEASSRPVAATHSNAKWITPSPRNKSREVLHSLVENGGVIGAAFWAPMAFRDPAVRPHFSDFLDHIDALVEEVGIDHVGIGSDLGEGESREYYEAMFAHGGGTYPEVTQMLGSWYDFDHRMVAGLESAVAFPRVTQGLVDRGYQPADIEKLLGGNFYRVLSSAWQA